jgi:hypothetical protein
MRICEGLALNFGDNRTGCCIMTIHRLTLPFPAGDFFFTKNNMTVTPHPPLTLLSWLGPLQIFSVPQLKIKLNEVIEAESQAVLNNLTEHDLQDAFKKL